MSILLVLSIVMCGLPSFTLGSLAAGGTFNVTVKASDGGKVSTDGTNWSDSAVVSVADGATVGDSVKYKADEGYKLDSVIAHTYIKKIAASGTNTAVIDASGNLYTAGDNSFGQLGRNLSSSKYYDSVLTKISDSAKITDVAMGMDHIAILDENGDVWTAGSNQYGALGRNDNVGKSYIGNPDFKKVTVGDGSIKIKAIAAGLNHTILVDENGGVWTAGNNQYGALGRSDNLGSTKANAEFKKADGLENVKIVKADGGTYHTILLDDSGNVWTAGTSAYGVLGRQTSGASGSITSNPTFEKVTDSISGVKIAGIAAGSYHNVLLDENGNVWTAGSNLYGELGREMTGSINNTFEKADLQGATGVKFIAANGSATVVIDTDGNARTCGINSGHLGRTVTNSSNPELLVAANGIDNTKMAAAAMGTYHTLLLNENGCMWSCGKNQSGQLCRTENLGKYTSVLTFAAVTDGLTQNITFDEMKNTAITSDRAFTVTSAVRERVQLEYDLGGGSWVDGYTPRDFIYKDEGLLLPDATKLEKPGYTFVEWETSSLTADPIKCSAKWTPTVFTVTFDASGGTVAQDTMTVTYGEEFDQMPIPTRMGYVFGGWYDGLDYIKRYGDENGHSTSRYDKTENCTLYAQWSEVWCKVTLDANGGTLSGAATRDERQNGPINEPEAPVKIGYTFTGWYKDTDCTQAWNFEDWVTGDMTLYAGWSINQYTITIKPENGEQDIIITEDYGTAITAPTLTKTGYIFAGWDKEFPTTMPADDLTITAQWTECCHEDSTAQPTCTDSAICTVCGGTIAALNHDFSVQKYDDNNHWKKCSRCDATANTEPHDWDTGIIITSPTCTTEGERKFTCNECSAIKIESIGASGHNWGQEWKYDEAHHWHECLNDNCDVKDSYNEHVGGTATCTAKAVCDLCHQPYGEVNPANHEGGTQQWTTRTATVHEKKWSCCGAVSVASEAHEWADGVCSECEYVCLHEDTDKDHVCDICEKTLSEHDDANKDHVCDYCGKTISDHEDTDKDHKCDLCSKTLSDHTGGKATCIEKVTCSECGESYGELDSDNHANLEHIAAKAATKKAKGNIEYWYCDDCGKYFSDAAATDEITKADTATKKLPSNKKDNKDKNDKNERDDKKGTDDKKSPKTGDTANLALWYALLLASGIILFAKKKKADND